MRCTFHGRQDPVEYYRQASLFFMASEFEGFPMTLVEAQMMGCVPIAFDTFDSLKEVITDGTNGRIIPNNDTKGFIDATIELMSHPDKRRELIQKGLNDCLRFSQKNICECWKTFIEEILNH